jgi:RecA/RadA recombinase
MTSNEEQLFELADKDLRITPGTITEKSFIVSTLRLKWHKILFSAQDELRNRKKERAKLVDNEIKKSGKSIVPRIQLEGLLSTSPIIQEVDVSIEQLSNRVILLQGIMRIFDEYNYSIKNAIESLKLEKNL